MPIDVLWTPPGVAVARQVSSTIRELQGDDPLRLVRVVAPDGATVDGLRRSLPLAGGSCGAEIGGTLRLARTIAAAELGARRVAPPVALLAIVQQVLADQRFRPAAFATCADHPATHDAIVRAYGTLNGVFTLPGGHAEALAALAGGRESAVAVTRVVVEVRRRLLAEGLVDAAEMIGIATRLAPADQVSCTAPLVLVVTQQFNPAHVGLLRVLATIAPRTVLVAAATSQPEVSVAAHVARIAGADPEATAAALAMTTLQRPVPTVVSCPDHDEEVREVARRIVGLLEDGVVADRIAVFYPPAGPHRSGIASALAAAGVPARGQVAPPLHGSIAGQVIRALLSLVRDGLDRRVLVDLARTAPFGCQVGDEGVLRTYARRADQWNRSARRHGVVGERDWARFESEMPDADQPGAGQHRALVGFVHLQLHHRDAVRRAATWRDAAAALDTWFVTHCGTVEWRGVTWKGTPTWQREAAEQVEGLFSVLADIDQFGLPYRTSTLARLVTAFLDTDVVTAESKGAGVFVDQIVGAAGAVADHVFVLGMNDHLVPGRVADDLVLTRAHGPEPMQVLTGPANRPLRDRRGVMAALDGAASSVTLLHSRWDVRSGGELYPSPLIPAAHVAEHVASHAQQLRSELAPWLDADEWFTRQGARTAPRLARRRRAISARGRQEPGSFDGQVGPLLDMNPLVRERVAGVPAETGITSLEQWVGCGLLYFVTRVLGATTDPTDPTDIADIEPLEKGTLVHAVFEALVAKWIHEHPAATTPWMVDAHDVETTMVRAELILDALAEPLATGHRLGHPEMWRARRTQMLVAMRRGLELEVVDQVVPVAAEFAFGSRWFAKAGAGEPADDHAAHSSDGFEAVPAVVWLAPDQSLEVRFTGSVDRIDRLGDGSLRVMDLKSGIAEPYRRITELDPLGPDRDKLQLAFYGWAVDQLTDEPVTRATYRFVGRPEAAADVGLSITPAVQAILQTRLHEITTAISAGQFVPGAVGTWGCDVCAPDGLGVYEVNQRRIEWFAAVDSGGQP